MALEGLACSETSLDCRAALVACISLACFRRAVVSSSCTARQRASTASSCEWSCPTVFTI